MRDIAVLGAGGWGTALAIHLGRLGKPVRLWGRDPALVARLCEERSNETYLPGVLLPRSVAPTASLEEVLGATDCVVSAVPSHGTRELLRRVALLLRPDATIVSGTKGFELGTLNRMSRGHRAGAGRVPTRGRAVWPELCGRARARGADRCTGGKSQRGRGGHGPRGSSGPRTSDSMRATT